MKNLKEKSYAADDPTLEYRRRLALRREDLENCRQLDRMTANARLAVAIAFLAGLYFAFWVDVFPGWVVLIPVAFYVALVIYHEHVYRMGRRATQAVAFYERGLARIEDRWAGSGQTSAPHSTENHLYAADLDLFGNGSLFELLCTARTRSGEETLAAWLCAPAARDEILKRQQAIEELRNNIDLREDLAVLGPDLRASVRPELMARWGNSPSVLESVAARVIAPVLAAFLIWSLLYSFVWNGNVWVVVIALALAGSFALFYRTRVRQVIADVDEPARELEILGLVLARLERERFTSPKLKALRAELEMTGKPPSRQIQWLKRLLELLNSRLNMMFAPLAYLMLWSTQLTFAIEAWRRRCGPSLERWLDAVGELEALCAVAGYAYEHPMDPFPEITDEPAIFEGEELRHPLLPADRCVPNSLRLGGPLRLFVVSGSNMSGKSTLLRTVGVNVVLALAGAPVRAKHVKTSVLGIGATLRVQDSLQGGTSRFYAEIQRLYDIMELTKGPLAVLFLLDEILHGTNSHDRAIGAEAVVRGLVERGAIGLVTTHDLALAKVADALAPRAANIHFQDHLEAGKMVFDYRLHAGVVQKSNALELMRAIGLNV